MSVLSKTHYLQFLQCPKLLWLSTRTPEVIPSLTEADEHRMNEGRKVEELARQMFDGSLVEHDGGLDSVLEASSQALDHCETGDCVFRPVVQAGDLVAEMDIVRFSRQARYDIHEVKSSTSIKAGYLPDIAFQAFVLKEAGFPLGECGLVTVHTAYVRHGPVSPSALFTIMDVTAGVEDMLPSVRENAAEALRIMELPSCPDVAIGPHCSGCPMKDTEDGCWADVNAKPCNVFSLYRLQSKRAWGWYEQGYLRSADIPDDFPLSDRQRIQIAAEQSGEPHVSQDELRRFIASLTFPLFFLDFETMSSAIPMLDNTSPYQQIPFQFSLHILRDSLGGEWEHVSWIWVGSESGDPRKEMLEYLASLLGKVGSVVAYNSPFEKRVLKQAAEAFPEHRDRVEAIRSRFVDLLIPFRNFWAYHSDQHGSCSIKHVLPAWTDKGYEGMEIADGESAAREYTRVMFSDADEADRAAVMKNLEDYCALDTTAMIDLMRVLAPLAEESQS